MMNSDGNVIATTATMSIGPSISTTMMSDTLSDDPSSPESTTFDDSDILGSTVHDDVTAQLAAAGKFLHQCTRSSRDMPDKSGENKKCPAKDSC